MRRMDSSEGRTQEGGALHDVSSVDDTVARRLREEASDTGGDTRAGMNEAGTKER